MKCLTQQLSYTGNKRTNFIPTYERLKYLIGRSHKPCKKHFVPEVGLEPTRPQWPRDFKSLMSTNFIILAFILKIILEPLLRIERRSHDYKSSVITFIL